MRLCLSPEREREVEGNSLSPPSLLSALIGTDPPKGTSRQCEPSTAEPVSEGVRHIVHTQDTRARVSGGESLRSRIMGRIERRGSDGYGLCSLFSLRHSKLAL